MAGVEFDRYLDTTLAEARHRIGLEVDLLLAYYAIERRRYPDNPASRRLLMA